MRRDPLVGDIGGLPVHRRDVRAARYRLELRLQPRRHARQHVGREARAEQQEVDDLACRRPRRDQLVDDAPVVAGVRSGPLRECLTNKSPSLTEDNPSNTCVVATTCQHFSSVAPFPTPYGC